LSPSTNILRIGPSPAKGGRHNARSLPQLPGHSFGRTPVKPSRATKGGNLLPACLALIGIILPQEVQVLFGGAKFTAGRIAVILLLFPALFMWCQRGRRLVFADFFAWATAVWMLVAGVSTGGWASLPSAAGAETLEFIGGYIIARGFFFEPARLNPFVRVLRIFGTAAVLLALADTISGRWVAQDLAGAIFHVAPPGPVYREGIIRATSTFDHPILFGTFCSLVTSILLYSKLGAPSRIVYIGIFLLGSFLSLSSAALLSFFIILALYSYDQLMNRYAWRWQIVWLGLTVFLAALFLLANHPIGWLISHLTLDPVSGYFRLIIWDAGFTKIEQSPLTGFGFNPLNHPILDATVDSVWLLSTLRFGIPMIILLILAHVFALWPSQRGKQMQTGSSVDELRRGFNIVLLMFMFTGLTVHFWNFMWIFWGLCLGIRASLREYELKSSAVCGRQA
jgi:hypothetical protein